MRVITLFILIFSVAATSTVWAAKKSPVGNGLKRSKNLRFDGRNVEAVGGGRFDSFTHLSEGDDAGGTKKLYEIPSDFNDRAAEASIEMGYRK